MCRALGGDGFTIGYSNRTLFLFCVFLTSLSGCGSSGPGSPEICEGGVIKTPVQISVGAFHTCAVDSEGGAWCWGNNGWGRLGTGDIAMKNTAVPAKVFGLTGVRVVKASSYHTCAILEDGTAWCWGENRYGKLGNGLHNRYIPVQVHGLEGAVDISSRLDHTCALDSEGLIWCWGRNDSGQLGDGTTEMSRVPVRADFPAGAKAVSAGAYHTCAVDSSYRPWCWGNNKFAGLGNGTTNDSTEPVRVSGLENVIQISAAWCHTCALDNEGSVWCWGCNKRGQLGDGTTEQRMAPVRVKNLTGIVGITQESQCALDSEGSVWCWGINERGLLGGETDLPYSSVPLKIQGLSDIIEVDENGFHGCALDSANKIHCWGWNHMGQLGDGTTIDATMPVEVMPFCDD